jgi:adenylate kinase family enzyme
MRSVDLPRVALDETHHVTAAGTPAYANRFTRVGKFHAPGLAPVQNETGAFHITPEGRAAYAFRFHEVFGFYERLAAVRLGDDWAHIREDGTRAYSDTYAWCGNFQEQRCAVRSHEGEYFHINPDGQPIYVARHLYAGDFRDGIACVRLTSGVCAHVDANGDFVHSGRFLDLDVFHKGFARARDQGGWFHLNRSGSPAYTARYAEVEPFYNGQAYALNFDGQRLILDERGAVRLRVPVAKSTTENVAGPVLVFIGAPGAGKTTLARCLCDRMGLRLIAIDEARITHGDGSTAGEMRAWAQFLGRIENGAVDVVEFSGSGPFVWHVKQALQNAKRPYCVVWIQTPVETCVSRISARSASVPYPFRVQSLEETTRELGVRLAREINDELYWKKDELVRVDSTAAIEEQISQLVPLLRLTSPSTRS